MSETDEHQEMTPEELNDAYFVCPSCGQLAERGRLGMEGDSFMCTQCGCIHNEKKLEREKV